jgi:hypothetical protein
LQFANLQFANLQFANFQDANLQNTCLDPTNVPNGICTDFEKCGQYVVGYRTQASGYLVGKTYTASVFSTCPKTECHPGLYICPTKEQVLKHYCYPLIRVYVKPEDIHKVGDKYRCRMFEVKELLRSKS